MFAESSPGFATLQSLIAACSGLLGVLIGGSITAWNPKKARQTERVREQLREFYSPLLGMWSEIKAKSEVQIRIAATAGAVWAGLFEGIDSPDRKQEITDRKQPEFYRLTEYSNQQLVNEIVPLYRKMLTHFTDNMWLAEPSTLQYQASLFQLVEIWNRYLSASIPNQVINKLEIEEKELVPFYQDLQIHFDSLSKKAGR